MEGIKNYKPKEIQCIEDVYKLSVNDFPKKLLHPLNSQTRGEFGNGTDYRVCAGKSGQVTAKTTYYDDKKVLYSVDLNSVSPKLMIKFDRSVKGNICTLSQTIDLETQELTFGERWYFTCQWCNQKTNTLFLIPANPLFGCRRCQNLTYESARINKKTLGGYLFYQQKIFKLAEKRRRIKRFIYNNLLTKKTQRLIYYHEKWRLAVDADIIRMLDAQTITAIKIVREKQYQ